MDFHITYIYENTIVRRDR